MEETTLEADDAAAGEDRSVSLERANVLALVISGPIALLTLGPYLMVWGIDGFGRGWGGVGPLIGLLIGALLFTVAVVVHEALHALGFLLAGVPRRSIHFGVDPKTLSPFAGCRVPMRAGAYRVSLLLPTLVLGIAPLLAAWALGNAPLVLFAFWMLAAAGGDLVILWLIRDLPRATLVADHPTRAGCSVVAPAGE